MSKLSFKEWSILSDLQTIVPLGEDFEFSMARGELKTAQSAITRLIGKLKGEGDLEAWVQSKITKAAEYLDTVADHLSHGEDDTVRTSEVKEAVLGRYKEDRGGGKTLRSASERLKPKSKKSEENPEPEGPKVTRLKTRGPRKGEATASQVQGWRGSDRTNTNRRGQSDPQAKLAMKEGFKGHKSVEEIAKKHKVSPSVIQKQLEMGMKVEHEHTTDNDQAMDIALQHLDEIPNYYSKLKKMEKVKEDTEILDAEGNLFATVIDIIKGSDDKFKGFTQPITEDAVKELENGLKKLDNTSYDSIDKLMRRIMEKHNMSAKDLHNAFVTRHDKTPDEWIKNLSEETKSGDSSLRDWFTKSRSSDGIPGWVQLGGKYAGKSCAKQPGQTTKPKCGSSKMKSDLSDKEEESAFRRKNEEDPNPDRKGKAKMVATEEKDACYSKVKSRYSVWPSAYASGALVKCRKVGAKNWGTKKEDTDFSGLDDQDIPMKMDIHHEGMRYCPKCKKSETGSQCKYGEKYWRMFSIPSSLSPEKPFSIAKVHPANEQTSFEIGSGHKQVQKQAKIRNLATGTTNPNEKSAALRKLSGPSLPLADSVIQPGQLTTEDYQRIQSTGNVYTILFSWRGRPMMNLQLFFPNMKRPSKDEVKSQIEKLYPGAVVMQWYPSPTDPSKPIVVIQGN
jgi:hypothetical protein